MFKNLWKRDTTEAAVEQFEFEIARTHGGRIAFNGKLLLESSGINLTDYHAGEPYHCLKVYRMESNAFAVVVEFHRQVVNQSVDAEIVEDLDEMEDFFCLHAADYLLGMMLSKEETAGDVKDLERRVLARFDLQVLQLLKQLKATGTGFGGEMTSLQSNN